MDIDDDLIDPLGACDWQCRTDRLTQRGRHLLETGIWSDCKFVVGNDNSCMEFHAHKLILSMASPVFATMFNASFKETEGAGVRILDVQPDAFATLLKYIYTDEITISSFDHACELCYVANKYMMPVVVKSCSAYIWKDVNYSNACRAYEFALLFDQEQLKTKCTQIIGTETEEVIRHVSFTDVELSTIHMILDQDDLFISGEIQLYNAIVFWAAQEFKRRGISGDEHLKEQQELVEPLFAKLRFLLISAEDFALGPAKSPLLTQEQKYAILINISSQAAGIPMPPGFSSETRNRNYQVKHKMTHFLCKPDLIRDGPVKTLGLTESAVVFTCNRDIRIHGVQMMAQFSRDCRQLVSGPSAAPIYNTRWVESDSDRCCGSTSNTRGCRRSTYRENIYIFLEEVVKQDGWDGWTPVSGKIENFVYKDILTYGEVIEVKFSKPGRVLKGRYYKLALGLNVPGTYVKWTLKNPTSVAHSCTFHFYNLENSILDSGLFFQAIIFNT